MPSVVDRVKRAFVSVLLRLAQTFDCRTIDKIDPKSRIAVTKVRRIALRAAFLCHAINKVASKTRIAATSSLLDVLRAVSGASWWRPGAILGCPGGFWEGVSGRLVDLLGHMCSSRRTQNPPSPLEA